MREIKFRAWDENSQEMIYEVGITPEGIPYSIPENAEGCDQFNYFLTCHKMQYTGLKDRNGREIYEGDILQISNKENQDYHMEVLWTGQGFGYRIIRNETKRSGYIVGHHSERGLNFYNGASEVIGNIYEDPELLEASHASK